MFKPLFSGMPVLDCSIILVQHMPGYINANIATSIGQLTRMKVKLAENEESIEKGIIYVAPSGMHLRLRENRKIVLTGREKVNFCCPSIDVAMESVAADPSIVIAGAVLTGMGKDGAQGIVHLKRIGAVTMAQDEASSIIFGMPKTAIATGCVDFVLSPEQMKEKLTELFRQHP